MKHDHTDIQHKFAHLEPMQLTYYVFLYLVQDFMPQVLGSINRKMRKTKGTTSVKLSKGAKH